MGLQISPAPIKKSRDSSENEKWKYCMTQLYYFRVFTQRDLSQHITDIHTSLSQHHTQNGNCGTNIGIQNQKKMSMHINGVLYSHKENKIISFSGKII